jgi:hypothetical protein
MADIWHIIEKYWIRVWTKFKWFQDDNAPVHRAQITENYKQENNIKLYYVVSTITELNCV